MIRSPRAARQRTALSIRGNNALVQPVRPRELPPPATGEHPRELGRSEGYASNFHPALRFHFCSARAYHVF